MSDETKRGIKVCLEITPGDDTRVFRLHAADNVLRHLVDAHESEFTLKDLTNATGHSRSTIWRAVEFLDELGVVQVRETPQKKYVAIDPEQLQKDDPILGIEQVEYHAPIRAFVQKIETAIEDADNVEQLLGILIFGSVARGEADRKSDVDVFVLVDGDRTVARRIVADATNELSEKRFNGDRYTFEPFVESEESARRAGAKLDEIFREGITVYGDDEFQQVRTEVMSAE